MSQLSLVNPFRRLWGPIGRGVSSNVYGQLVTIMIQFGTLPVLISSWGVAKYGLWLTISAVPSYLSMTDFGFATAASNEMTMAVSRGEYGRAKRLYQSSFVLISVMSCITLLASISIVWLLPSNASAFRLFDVSTRWALTALLCSTIAALNYSLSSGALRADGKYASGIYYGESTRLLEAFAVIIAASCGGGLAIAASCSAIVRLASLLGSYVMTSRLTSWAGPGISVANRADIAKLAAPALGVMVIPLAFALNIQGITLVVSTVLGVSVVALFNVSRTFSRVVYQLVGIVNHALMPEVSRAHGSSDRLRLAKLMRLNFRYSLTAGLCSAAFVALASPLLVRLWTHNRLAPPLWLCASLTLAVLVQSIWNARANMLLAINRHVRYSIVFFLSSVVIVGLAVPLTFTFGLQGAVISSLLGEIFMLVYITRISRKITDDLN